MKHLFSFRLALATFAAAASAQAQQAGDLILGFNSIAAGSGTNLEVDIGSVGDYYLVGLAHNPPTYTVANLSSTLTSLYGANWASSSSVYFGIAGAGNGATGPNGQPGMTLWASSSEGLNGKSPAYVAQSSGAAAAPSAAIASVVTDLSSGSPVVALNSQNNPFSHPLIASTLATSVTGSWTQAGGAVASGPGFGMTAYGSGVSLQTLVGGGGKNTVDLYQIEPLSAGGSVSDLGRFMLSSNGILSFTPIPEPPYAAGMLAAAAFAGVVAFRRQRAGNVSVL